MWWVGLGLLAILAALITAMGMLKTSVKQSAPPLAVQAPPPTAPPLQVGKPTMPKDIHDWLDHLRQTEDMKNALSLKQESDLMQELTLLNGLGAARGMYDDKAKQLDPDSDKSPVQGEKDKIGDLVEPWRDVIKFFESVPPPTECQNLANTYDQALDEVSGQMRDIQDILTKSDQDSASTVDKLTKLQGTSTGTIDKYFALADDGVSQICDKYQTAKWFKIKADVGNGMSGSGMPQVPVPGASP